MSTHPVSSDRDDLPQLVVRIPLRTGRGQNDREHHMVRARRVRHERWTVGLVLNTQKVKPALPCVVLLTRLAPAQRPLDDDNLRGSLKAVRDEVARWLGVDDGSDLVRWVYAQQKSPRWGVIVMVQEDDADEPPQEPMIEVTH